MGCMSWARIWPFASSHPSRNDRGVQKEGLSTLILPLFLLFVGLGGLSVAYVVTDSAEGQFIVLGPVSGGFAGTVDLISRAEGAVIGTGAFGNLLVAASDEADFPARLRQAGAWMVLPAPKALGCESPTSRGTEA